MTNHDFRDRRISLIIGGVIYLLIAGFMLFGAAAIFFMSFSAELASKSGMTPLAMRMSAISPAALGLSVLTLAYGAFRSRRWARAFSVVLGWAGIAIGVMVVAMFAFQGPEAFAGMSGKSGDDAAAMAKVMYWVVLGFAVFMYLGLPGILLALFSGSNARLTCESRNPAPSWTDAAPLPVIGAVLFLIFAGIVTPLSQLSYIPVFPLFGALLTGTPALLVQVLLAAVYLYAARGLYRLDIRALYLSISVILIWGVSSFVTFRQISSADLYRAMGMSEMQIEMAARSPFGGASLSYYLLFSVPWVLYLVWIKRYFKRSES